MIAFYIVVAISIGLVLFLQSPKGKGIVGEWRVNKVLKKSAEKYGGIELSDFMFEDNRSSSQIDNMLLTNKALYVIEVKNYKGHIFGTEEQVNWTVTVKHVNKKRSKSGKVYKKTNISKHQFYNPLKQNKTHINKIKNLTDIHDYLPVLNIVVFGKNATIRNVKHSPSTYVLHQSEIKRFIDKKEKEFVKTIKTDLLTDITDKLFDINIIDRKRRKKHVADLKRKHK